MLRNTILLLTIAGSTCAAGTLDVLRWFGGSHTIYGNNLYSGLILDGSGNLYGGAESGGKFDAGVIYELSPASGGAWTETVLYNFKGAPQDGASPHATLLMTAPGNFYGTTVSGGLTGVTCRAGCGTVFQLTNVQGQWQETVLYRFTGGADGAVPYAGVSMDPAGNLYGATITGGAGNAGVVYKLSPGASGWLFTVLHTFQGRADGAAPYPTPLLDAASNLYGTTNTGGAHNHGVVFKLALQPDGSYINQTLHTFAGGADGENPLSGVIFDSRGNLYGATSGGGSANCGTVYRLVQNTSGQWKEQILHTFLGLLSQDGANPIGIVFDPHGNLYGTSTGGGLYNPGTIFRMTRNPGGGWTETVLYSFTGGNDGAYPSAGPTLDPDGHIYGTTLWGGPVGDTTGGVVFEFTP